MPSISIIIPALNEEDHIGDILSDLSSQTYTPQEIIVVDGNSSDNTRKISSKYKNVTLLKSLPSPAHQRNYGGHHASGNLLVFLDADVRLKKDFLEKVLSINKRHTFTIACPYYLPYKSTLTISLVYYFFNAMFFVWQKISPSGAGSCIIVTKEIFKKIKGFNTSLRYDDIAFVRQAAACGIFAMLPLVVRVSDRRFHRDGVIKTTLRYIVLSFFFLSNQFKSANNIPYRFNHYKR